MIKSAPSLYIKPGPSRQLALFIVASHLLAIVASLANHLPVPAKALLVLVVLVSFIWQWKKHQLKPDSLVLKHNDAKGWELIDQQGKTCSVTIGKSSVATTFLTVLHLEHSGRLHHIMLIPRDSVSAEDYRKLVVRLKISSL